MIVSAVLQRITLIGRCRTEGRCPVHDPGAWPNYRVLLAAAEPGIQEGDAVTSLFRRTHAAYLSWLADQFPNDLAKVLAAYNAGEQTVVKYQGIPPYKETRDYVRRIFTTLGLTVAKM